MNDSNEPRHSWTPQMVFWNTLGTVTGAVLSGAALVIAIIALLK